MRLLSLIVCILSALMLPIRADDAVESPAIAPLRALIVPLDEPQSWPSGDWQSISAAEYSEFVDWVNQQGSPVEPAGSLGVAEYTGEFDGNDLIQGQVTFDLKSPLGPSRLVPLGEFSTRLQDLHWQDGTEPVWGAASNDLSFVWIDRDEGQLAADWFQQGQRYTTPAAPDTEQNETGFVRFDLTLPAAISSRLKLRIPASRYLLCTEGLATNTAGEPGTDFNEWTLECGSRGRLTFVIFDESPIDAQSLWVAEITTIVNAKTDGVHFDAELTVESSGVLPQDISLRIPREMAISSVQTASETAVEYRVSANGSRGTLHILLSQPVSGRGVFRVRGIMPLSIRRAMVFPFITIPESHVEHAAWILKVDRPLEVKQIDPQGLLQTSLAVTAQGESWNFTPIDEEPRLAFEVGLPQTSVAGLTWNLVDLARPLPESTAVTELECERGSLFTGHWILPRDWTVTSVQSSDIAIAAWSAHVDPEALSQTLTVEFRDPLEAGERCTVEIKAQSQSWRLDQAHPLPITRYLDGESGPAELLMRLPHGVEWSHNATDLAGPYAQLAAGRNVPTAVAAWWNAPVSSRLERWEFQGHDESAVCRLVSIADASGEVDPQPPQHSEGDPIATTTPRCRIRVETHIAGVDRSHHTHECRLELQPHQETSLHFTLDSPAEVLAVYVDGRTVETQIVDDRLQVAIESESREVRIDYLTPAGTGVFAHEILPLPRTSFESAIVNWELLLPPDRGLVTHPSGVVVTGEAGGVRLAQRLLGPLARGQNDSVFGIPDSSGSIRSSSHLSDEEAQTSLMLVADGGIDHLQLELWDTRTFRSASWTSLMGAFLFLLMLRRIAPQAWKYVGLLFFASGFAAAWLGSPPVALVSGGLLMGTLLAAATPRNLLLRSRKPRAEQQQSSVHAPSLAGSSFVLRLFVVVGLVSSVGNLRGAQPDFVDPSGDTSAVDEPAAAAPGGDIEVDSSEVDDAEYDLLFPVSDNGETGPATTVMLGPRLQQWHQRWLQSRQSFPTLINSARYALSFPEDGLPLVAAELNVLIPSDGTPQILLPFRDVVVVNGGEAMLNDETTTLIPAASGEGLLLVLPDDSESAVSIESTDDASLPMAEDEQSPLAGAIYQSATITFSFRVREGPGEETEPTWTAGVPRVSQTEIILSSADTATYRVEGSTLILPEGDQFVLPLAPADRLSLSLESGSQLSPSPRIIANSAIEIRPTASSVRAELELVDVMSSSEPFLLPVRLPPRSVLRNVGPTAHTQFFVDGRGGEPVVWIVIPDPGDLSGPIVVEYLLVAGRAASDDWLLPPIEYHRRQDLHLIEVTPGTGFQWDLRPQSMEGMEVLTSDQIVQRGIATATPETVVAQLSLPVQTQWSLEPIAPAVTAQIEEQLELEHDSKRWSADLTVETAIAPVFQYVFNVGPSLVVQSVSVRSDAAERTLRWRQSGDRLYVFAQSDQSATRQIEIDGLYEASPSSPFQWPRFELYGADADTHQRSLANESGRALIWDATSGQPGRLESGEETIFDPAEPPANLRYEAADERATVSQSIWMMPAGPSGWTVCQQLTIARPESPLPPQNVRIPESWSDELSFEADHGTVREGTDDEGQYIRIEDIESPSVVLTLLSHLPAADASPDMAEIEGASTESTLLYLPRSAPLDASDWVEVAASGSSPPLAPDEFAGFTDWLAYHPPNSGASLPTLPDAVAISLQRVLHAETSIFASSDTIIGQTQYDLFTGGQATFSLGRPSGATIEAVSVDGVPVVWNPQEPTIPIPRDQACSLVTLIWTGPVAKPDHRLALHELLPLPNSVLAVQHYICCWNQTEDALWLPRGVVAVSREQLWRERWSDLNEVADRLGTSASDDLALVWRMSQCVRVMDARDRATAQTHDTTGTEGQMTAAEISERWDEMQSRIDRDDLFSPGDIEQFESQFPSWDTLGEGGWTAYRLAMGYLDPRPETVTRVPPAESPWKGVLVGTTLASLILLVGFWMLRRPRRYAWSDRLARHPHLVWFCLGVIWWLFLAPSVGGALIVVAVIVHTIYLLLAHVFVRARTLVATSTVRR